MLRRFLILPALALVIGLGVNAFHPHAVRWDAGGRAAGINPVSSAEPLDPPLPIDPATATMPEGLSLDAARAWMNRERVVLLDVRSVADYKAGHITGAVSFPMADDIRSTLPDFLRRYGRHTPLLIYCDSDACPRAMDMALVLINAYRYASVRYLEGGYYGWQDEGSVPLDAEARR